MSTPMKKQFLPSSRVRIFWSTVYVGDVVIWGDVGETGSVCTFLAAREAAAGSTLNRIAP
jgi:hypothetical protein